MTREEAKQVLIVKAGYGKFVEDIIDQIFNDHEAQIKAKDEEIHYLKTQMTGWSMMFDEPQDAKAHSIVAMLFWEWRKSIRESGYNTFYNDEFDDGNYWFVNAKEQSFKQAYKMIKDNQ